MPVSPQDFELYSRMTGAPMPSDAMSRMQMAPDVYKFTKNFARKPNLLEKTGNLIKSAGRNTLVGAGLLAGMDLENQERQREELIRNESDKAEAESVTMENPVEEVADSPAMAKIRLQMKADEIKHQNKLELQDRMDARAGFSREGQQPTTADAFGQDLIENQTADNVVDKKMEQGSQIADSTPNIAEVLSESQDSIPASIFRPTQIPTMGALQAATPVVASGLSEAGNEVNVIKGVEEEMVGSGATSGKVENFLKKMGGTDEGSKLDVALLAAMQDRDKKEKFYLGANSGDPDLGNSPLIDHPDLPGGEDDINLPSGTNTSSTQNLSDFHKEMRKMDAMERNKEVIDKIVEKSPSPSEMQVGKSPNELAGKDQATFEALMHRNAQLSPDAEGARSRIEQKTAAQQRKLGIKSRLTDQFYPSNVARTDIQLGGMVDRKTGLGKSVGISYTPMNGDTKVGFNVMNDPTKPREVSTFDFVAPPETMESLQSQKEEDLGSKTFGKLFNIARQKKQGFSGMEM